MNFRRSRKRESAVEASALSDILFFLLLFFLIISTLASANAIKLTLPKAATGQTIPNKQKINLYIREENNMIHYYIENDKHPVTFENLLNELTTEAEKLGASATVTVALRADETVVYGEVIKVIDVCNQARLPVTSIVDKRK